jgi:hypothetical protein
MNFNTEEEREALKLSLIKSGELDKTLFCLEVVLSQRTPFALYVATQDKSNCTWIFDAQMIYEMLGGKEKYLASRDSLLKTEEEKSSSVLFFVLNKVGPFYAVKMNIEIIEDLINELYEEL